MIEIKPIEYSAREYEMCIDGRRVDVEIISGDQIRLTDATVTELFMSKHFSDVSLDHLTLESFPGMLEWWEAAKQNNVITIKRIEATNAYHLIFFLYAFASNWKRLWTFSDYTKEFKSIADSRGFPGMYLPEFPPVHPYDSELISEIAVHFDVDARDRIGDQITRCSEILRQIHQETEKSLSAKLRADSVVMYFDFPRRSKNRL